MSRKLVDSGVSWIGKIPEGWTLRRNKYLFSCVKEVVGEKEVGCQLLSLTTTGIKKRSRDDVTGKVPESYETYQAVHANDLVMCLFDLDCSAVFSGVSKFDGMISPAYRVLTCSDSADPRFYGYWFDFVFVGRKYKRYAKNVRYSIGIDEFGALYSAFPPLAEQQRIAAFLDRECEKIDGLRGKIEKQIEKLDELKKSTISEAVTGKIGVGGRCRSRKMKPSGVEWIGDVPEEWKVTRISYCFTVIGSGTTPSSNKEEYYGEGVNWVQSGDLYGRVRVKSTIKCVTPEAIKDCNLRIYKHPFISVAMYGASIANTCIVELDACTNQACCNLSDIRSSSNIEYVYYALVAGRESMLLHAQGGTQPNINRDVIARFRLPLPPLAEQKEIAEYLDKKCAAIDAAKEKCRVQLEKLAEYKKSLIYEYVTGKKEVA